MHCEQCYLTVTIVPVCIIVTCGSCSLHVKQKRLNIFFYSILCSTIDLVIRGVWIHSGKKVRENSRKMLLNYNSAVFKSKYSVLKLGGWKEARNEWLKAKSYPQTVSIHTGKLQWDWRNIIFKEITIIMPIFKCSWQISLLDVIWSLINVTLRLVFLFLSDFTWGTLPRC